MDELQKLLEQARAALARGADSTVVNQRFAEVTGGRANTLAEAEQLLGQANAALARGADSTAVNQRLAEVTRRTAPRPDQPQEEGRLARGLRGAGRDLASLADAALLGFPSALTGALEELGLFSEGTTEEMREDIEAATPGTSLLGAIAPAALGFGGITAASRVPGISRAASQAAVRQAGARPELLRGVRGAAGAAARAAPVPAAEGALIGAGGAEGDPLEQALVGGLLGGATGGAAGGTLRGLGGLLGVLRRPGRRAERVRTAFGDVSRGVPERGEIEAGVRTIDEARRVAFREAERAAVPSEITDLVRTNPAARRALERSGSQEAKEIAQNFRAVEAAQGQPGITEARRLIAGGEFDFESAPLLFEARFPGRRAGRAPGAAPEPRPVDFQVAQDIRNDLNRTADAFRRRQPDASGRVPSNAEVREAEEAVELLDEQLSQVPGFREGMKLTAAAGERRRALADGRKAFTSLTAEQIEDHLSGAQRAGKLSVPRSLEGQTAFRRGLVEPLEKRLRGSEGQALSAMRSIRSSPELQGKLQVALGDEKAAALIRFVEREARFESTEKAAKEVIKYLGFVLAGSSLAGGAILGGEILN